MFTAPMFSCKNYWTNLNSDLKLRWYQYMKQQHLKMYLKPFTIQQFHTSVIQYIDQT